jgi:hypothetical protein
MKTSSRNLLTSRVFYQAMVIAVEVLGQGASRAEIEIGGVDLSRVGWSFVGACCRATFVSSYHLRHHNIADSVDSA